MHEPITSLYSLQSKDAERMVQEDKPPNNDEIMVSFADLKLDPEDNNVFDDMIMSETEYLLKAKENRLRGLIESVKKTQVERFLVHSNGFEHEINKLCDVAMEHYIVLLE
ncbi:unnamed protein product [Lactuca saligna]|uniref:Uncharacterized protein n=1 Tax=Lactuca saligna TaxID=75948 RepID=A0AA35Y6G8_LACSI|nr:unnamed protein product [Lactuca saligna]